MSTERGPSPPDALPREVPEHLREAWESLHDTAWVNSEDVSDPTFIAYGELVRRGLAERWEVEDCDNAERFLLYRRAQRPPSDPTPTER